MRLLNSNWSEPDGAFYLVLEYQPYSLDRYFCAANCIPNFVGSKHIALCENLRML